MKSSKKIAKIVRRQMKTMEVDFRDAHYEKVNVLSKTQEVKVNPAVTVKVPYETYTAVLDKASGRSLYKHLINLEKVGL